MFARLSTIFFSIVSILVLAGVAIGAPADIEARTVVNQCNTGTMQCCDSTHSASSTTITSITSIFGVVLPSSSSNSLVGISCSPTTMGGIGSGAACTQQPVCCNGVAFNGLMNVGCSPITINM